MDLQASAQRVRLLGGDPDHPASLIQLRAPVSGTIVEQNVAGFEGIKSLDNSPNLFTIADLSEVWVLCDVYENDLAAVRVGDPQTSVSTHFRIVIFEEESATSRVFSIPIRALPRFELCFLTRRIA